MSDKNTLFSKSWFVYLLFIPFVQPVGLVQYSVINRLMTLWLLASAMVITILFFRCNDQLNWFIIAIIAYHAVLIISTFVYQHGVGISMERLVSGLFVCMLLDIGCKYDADNMIKSIYRLLYVWIVLNLLTLVIYHGGRANGITYFLGIRVDFVYAMLTAAVLGMICVFKDRKKYLNSYILLSVIIIGSIGYVWAASGVTVIVLFFMMAVLLLWKRGLYRYLSFRFLTISAILLNISIVFFRIQNIFGWFIEGVLGKSTTFTGRTAIWNHTIEAIQSRVIAGYGIGTKPIYIPEMGTYFFYAHNQILQILLESGIIGALLTLIVFVLCGKKVRKSGNNAVSIILTCGLFANLVLMITEVPMYFNYFFIFLTIIYHINDIQKNRGDVTVA